MLTANELAQIESMDYAPAHGTDITGKLRIMHFSLTAAAADTEALIVKIPAGRVRVLPHLSRFECTGVTGTPKIGHKDYVDLTPQANVITAVDTSVSGAVTLTASSANAFVNAKASVYFASRDDIQITMKATFASGATVSGYLVYAAL